MKFMTLTIIILGILTIFNFGGIDTPTTGGVISSLISDVEAEGADVKDPISQLMYAEIITVGEVTLSLWMALLTMALAVTAVGVRASLYGSAPPINYYLAPFVIGFGVLIMVDLSYLFLEVWKYSETWMRMVYTSIFLSLGIMYMLSMKSYLEGTD